MQALRSRAIRRDGFMVFMVGNICRYCKPNQSANYRQFIFIAASFAVFWRDFGILAIARSEILTE
jgi:hypothetical protein